MSTAIGACAFTSSDGDALARAAARAWDVARTDAATATRRLSTGRRIDSAADDAAGLAIAVRLRAQYEGLAQASRNAQEGVNFLQVADGAYARTGDALQRIRVLAVQSANGTYDDAQRALLQGVVDRTIDEIDAVAHGASYAGMHLLDGSRDSWTLQVGAQAGDTFTVTLGAASADALGLDGTLDAPLDARGLARAVFAQAAVDLGPLSIATQEKARKAIEIVDRGLEYLCAERAEHGASLDRLEFMIRSLGVTAQNTQAAEARITDADIPAETARLMRARIAAEASATMMTQAHHTQAMVLELLRPLATTSVPTGPVKTVAAAAQAAGAPASGATHGGPASGGPVGGPQASSAPTPLAQPAPPPAVASVASAPSPPPSSPLPVTPITPPARPTPLSRAAWNTPDVPDRTHPLGAA